jgi:hypothetical protein
MEEPMAINQTTLTASELARLKQIGDDVVATSRAHTSRLNAQLMDMFAANAGDTNNAAQNLHQEIHRQLTIGQSHLDAANAHVGNIRMTHEDLNSANASAFNKLGGAIGPSGIGSQINT